VKTIPVGGAEAIVDDKDYADLARWVWTLERRGNRVYARRLSYEGSVRRSIYMHRQIAERVGLVQQKCDIDHADANGLNNCRSNLRPATRSQNNANQRLSTRNKSGFKGVYWSGTACKWAAQIGVAGKRVYLGLFGDERSAAQRYNKAAMEHYGPFARLNPL